MIGLFINTLPLRVCIDPQSRLLEWLRRIQEKVLSVRPYDYSPLARIRSWSGVPRDSSFFESILVFENYPVGVANRQTPGGLRSGKIRSIEQTTYPLTVAVTPGEQLDLRILYDPARFDPAVVRHLLKGLCQVLEGMVTDPNQRLSSLLPAAQSERGQFFESRPVKIGDRPSQTTLPSSFEQQVERASDRQAAAWDEKPVPGGSPLELSLIQIWKKLLKTDEVGLQDNFFDLGGDSLTGAICIQQLRDVTHEVIPLAAIFNAPTVFELAKYLERRHPAGVARLLGGPAPTQAVAEEKTASPATLVPIQPEGSRSPLFCIHPAGGIVFPYYTLASCLGKDRPLYGIQDPSLYDAQSSSKSIEAMAAHYLEALKTVQPEGPYHLLGWSVGGVVAYEMAQQLSGQGQSVAFLGMLDSSAPALEKTFRPRLSLERRLRRSASWTQSLPHRVQELGSAVLPVASYVRSGLFLLTASAKRNGMQPGRNLTFVDVLSWAGLDTWRTRLLREAQVANTISQNESLLLVEMPDVKRILELVREHRRLARRYVATPYQGRITLFRAVHSEASEERDGDPTMGWESFARRGVEVHPLRANHVALLVKPHVELLAQELKDCLDPTRLPQN